MVQGDQRKIRKIKINPHQMVRPPCHPANAPPASSPPRATRRRRNRNGFSFRELQKCADREVAMRRNVFAKRGMTDDRRLEIAKMEAIAAQCRSD
jgi:hypothetical protein